jgi:hypothetical protein
MTLTQKSETLLAGRATQANQKTDARIIGESETDRKQFATLAARFALVGHELHRLRDGGFLATRWGLSRELPTLADAEAFLRQIGGAS